MKTLRMTLQEVDQYGEYFMSRIAIELPLSGNIDAFIHAAHEKLERDLQELKRKSEMANLVLKK